MSIFEPQRGQKIQILLWSNMSKNCIKRVFRNKKSPQKPFFMILEPKKIFEKKIAIFTQKSEKKTIFRNFCGRFFGRKQTNSADLWQVGPFYPQDAPKFFLSQTDKNSRFYLKKTTPPKNLAFFWGGGGS